MSRQRIIIDCDPGQDDAVALFLAMASPEELEILGGHRWCRDSRAADAAAGAARGRLHRRDLASRGGRIGDARADRPADQYRHGYRPRAGRTREDPAACNHGRCDARGRQLLAVGRVQYSRRSARGRHRVWLRAPDHLDGSRRHAPGAVHSRSTVSRVRHCTIRARSPGCSIRSCSKASSATCRSRRSPS